ncbi:MAG: hypothetical protein JWM55_388 [Acidimicrobiaceae bacterium]|nr:hypothetical protein [Acidimicrobiaceae bacterium]
MFHDPIDDGFVDYQDAAGGNPVSPGGASH